MSSGEDKNICWYVLLYTQQDAIYNVYIYNKMIMELHAVETQYANRS
jgi:hypothetical protein